MFFQNLSFDLKTVTVSTTGRVLFYNNYDELVVAIKKTDDFQLHYSDNFLYIWKEGSKPVIGADGSVSMALGSLYRMTVFALEDIDGKSFTPITNQVIYSPEEYKAKQQEAFEWLESQVLVGCCDGGSGSSSVAFYPTFGDFPTTGTVDILYVDKETPALYLWDGSAYVAFGGGGAFIPLAGTDVGAPVTGDIQVKDLDGESWKLWYLDTDSAQSALEFLFQDISSETYFAGLTRVNTTGDQFVLAVGNGSAVMRCVNSSLEPTEISVSNGQINVFSSVSSFEGIKYSSDYSANFILSSLINLETMKKRIWTKAGTPDANDDSVDGYVVGSLIYDTTNDNMYRCTDNTAGAAVWKKRRTKSTISGRNIISMAASASTFFPLDGISTSNLNQPNDTTNFTGRSTPIVEETVFKKLAFLTTAAQPASGTFTMELYINNAATGLIVTVPTGSAAFQVFTATAATEIIASAGDNVGLKYTNNATSSSCVISSVMMLIEM